MDIKIIKLKADDAALTECFEIRHAVFVVDQNVPLHEEIDGKDEESTHYLLYYQDQPAATARIRLMNDYTKIERVAVLNTLQGKGLGFKLMQFILADLKNSLPNTTAKLSAQTHALSFYEKLGFQVCSEEYLDANIPHRDMILNLKNQSACAKACLGT